MTRELHASVTMADQNIVPVIANRSPEAMFLYSRTQIYDFLRDVAANPAAFNVPGGQGKAADLQSIQNRLKQLSLPVRVGDPGHAEFNRQSLTPDQHIYRQVNQGWRNDVQASKFHARENWNHQFIDSTIAQPYWSPYDLLGLFLSKLGPAQAGSTKQNFFLPLTAMYMHWCRTIAGREAPDPVGPGGNPRGVGNSSFYYNCTWDDNSKAFFLGASLAGFNWRRNVGQWELGRPAREFDREPLNRLGLKFSRYALLTDNYHPLGLKYDFDRSPVILERNPTGQRFGNCAETYPFMNMLGYRHNRAQGPEEMARYHGLALKYDYLGDPADLAMPYSYNRIIEQLRGQDRKAYPNRRYLGQPCENCRYLIRRAQANVFNFSPDNGL
ncbi:hypothetical protein FOZG_13690 [Fusarium oxysporum Fo47]|uniref:Uncharacterized protein n=2 Tax=Fusarium oxysporum Fo47 TaxID=660027 RepID=W9JXS9_FUSOX|nr:hypothetical protein FOZG_13690 [Fusarium oxysporum Fo47]